MSFRSVSSQSGIVTTPINESLLYQEIAQHQGMIKDVESKTIWPLIESAKKAFLCFKVCSMKISYVYVKLADYHYSLPNHQAIADQHWQGALKNLKACSDYLCENSDLNYQNCFDISSLYVKRVQLSLRQIRVISRQEQADFLLQGLAAVNTAIQIDLKPEAMYRKFMLLKMLEEMGEPAPESAMDWWRRYLEHHPDLSSEDYRNNAQLYGGELAKIGKLKEANEWFIDLLKKGSHPLTYLYLGKIADHLNQSDQALGYFLEAAKLDPSNLEIQLWLVSQKATLVMREVRAVKGTLLTAKVQEMVNVFNEFCSVFPNCAPYLKSSTSTFISLEELANHFYMTHVLDMAHILAQLQQYRFSLHLYTNILELFDVFVAVGALDASDKIKVYTSMGAIHLSLEEYAEAEGFLQKALQMDPSYAPALENLAAVYASQKDESKLSHLWSQVEPLLPDLKSDLQSTFSTILFNFGTAYALMGKDKLKKAQEFYEKSLELNNDNWDTRIHWARTLALTGGFSKAEELLIGYASRKSVGESPFGEFPYRDFQVYFCLAGIQALNGNLSNAEKGAILAGKTHCDPDETTNLQAYLKELKGPKPNKEQLHGQIQESIRKMGFTFRIGKITNEKSLTFHENAFIGYHGTIDVYLDDFKNGIKPKKSAIRQFSGEGFYIAPDRDIACYFAMKKMKDEGRGTPVILPIYADKTLVGKPEPTKKNENTHYDFFQAEINGFEKFSQFYVQENSLTKLRLAKVHEKVDWTEANYNKFMKSWTRSKCV